jgi:hypothetical protein
MGWLKPLVGLGSLVAAAGAYVGFDEYKAWKRSRAQWPLKAGEAYLIHVRYKGEGSGGPPTSAQVLSVLNANSAGALELANEPTIDTTNKVISFLAVPVAAYSLPATVLATGWPTAYGAVSALSVLDAGANPQAPSAPATSQAISASLAPAS